MEAQLLPKQVTLQEEGIRFEIPEGWTGRMEEDYIVLGHNTIPGIMLLFENEHSSAQALRLQALQGIDEDGLFLSAKSDFQITSENQVEGLYEGSFQGSEIVAYATGLVNDLGKGINLLVLAERTKFNEIHSSEAKKLVATVSFFEPVENEKVGFWKSRIIGAKLKYLSSYFSSDIDDSYVGSNRTITIDLCTNGRFYYENEGSLSVDSGFSDGPNTIAHSHDEASKKGTFEIYISNEIPYLDLNFDDDLQHTYKLSMDHDEVPLLNGERYFIDYIDKCQ